MDLLTSGASSRSFFFAFLTAFGLNGTAVTAADLPLTGTCTILAEDTPATVLSVSWDHDSGVVSGRALKEPAHPVGLREHGDGFKLSLFFQHPVTGPSEAVVFSLDPGDGVNYRIGAVSYDVLADGTRLLSSMSGFEDATCEVN